MTFHTLLAALILLALPALSVAEDKKTETPHPAASVPAVPQFSDAEAAAHVGETALVRGKVVSVGVSKQGNIYLNFGDAHPKQTFSAAIMAKDAEKFGDANRFEGKTVSVTGTIILYNGKPEIVLSAAEQMTILPETGK